MKYGSQSQWKIENHDSMKKFGSVILYIEHLKLMFLRVNEKHWAVNTLDTNNPFLLRGCNLNDSIDKVIKSLFGTTIIIKT